MQAPTILLAGNENPLGMPQAAREAATQAIAGAGRYPDPTGAVLVNALSRRLAMPPEAFVLGSGSCEVLTLAAQALVRPGERIVSSRNGFIVYRQAARLAHAQHTLVPERDYGHDLRAIRAAIDGATRLVFVANPNNPTGSFLPGGELLDFLQDVPPDVTVLLDEAYTEYLGAHERYDAIAWVRRLPNLLVTRTFSKAYGLAGLRVGYGVAQPALAARIEAIRPRYNLTAPALAAATAALGDEAFLARSVALNTAGRRQLELGFAQLGLRSLPSAGNFLMVDVGDGAAVHRALAGQGIHLSMLGPYGLPQWLRVTVGLPEQNTRVLQALQEQRLTATA